MTTARQASFATGLAACLLAFVGCSSGEEDRAASTSGELSLIWISLDTVRADHLQLYGYSRDTSPFLSELAARGLHFQWAVSPQNSTLPTHVTQFTGIHPSVHRVMHSKRNPGVRMADSVRTLPEVLTSAGFRSRAWTDGGKMHRHYGFARGFESYEDARGPFPEKLARVLESVDELRAGQRFFFFVHTYEAHAPYNPPPPYRQRYAEPGATPPREKMNLYDGSIRLIDDALRGFVGELDHRGVLDTTVLVITGDHGESFFDYGIPVVGHAGNNLHQNVTRVPWILLHPSARHRGEVTKLVGLVDFANTVLALVGVEERLPGDGIDVLAAGAPDDRSYVSWTGDQRRPGCAWSLFASDHHLLRCWESPGPERNALFHFRRDPLEGQVLQDPEKMAELEELLARRRRELAAQQVRWQTPLSDFTPLEEETREQLRALGYLDDSKQEPVER